MNFQIYRGNKGEKLWVRIRKGAEDPKMLLWWRIKNGGLTLKFIDNEKMYDSQVMKKIVEIKNNLK
jgi:hypothetical protein